jgi:hypothetical protein
MASNKAFVPPKIKYILVPLKIFLVLLTWLVLAFEKQQVSKGLFKLTYF